MGVLLITHMSDGEGKVLCGTKADRSVLLNKTEKPQAVTCKKCFQKIQREEEREMVTLTNVEKMLQGMNLDESLKMLDEITRKNTGFKTFLEILDAAGGYRPTIEVSDPDMLLLADAYDHFQEVRGDDRRASRYISPSIEVRNSKLEKLRKQISKDKEVEDLILWILVKTGAPSTYDNVIRAKTCIREAGFQLVKSRKNDKWVSR